VGLKGAGRSPRPGRCKHWRDTPGTAPGGRRTPREARSEARAGERAGAFDTPVSGAVTSTLTPLPEHYPRTAPKYFVRLPESGVVIDALPDRALTNEEAEQLKQQDSRIVPLSVLKGGDDPFVIYTMAFYRSDAGVVHLLGYAESTDGWVEFESFPEEEWTIERQEDRVQEWIDEEYGDEFEQGMLDEDSGTVDLG